MPKRLLIPLFLVCSVNSLLGQGIISVSQYIYPPYATHILDSVSIAPGSLVIFSQQDSIPHSFYKLDWLNGTISFIKIPNADSLLVTYNSLGFKANQAKKLREWSIITDETEIEYNEMLDRQNNKSSVFKDDEDELEKVGSISRGVAFGNNQNLSVNSHLDLQLSGKLSDNYNLVAALSDRNIPIQPEGTTSNIQEFDQVYVKLDGKGNNLVLGDFFIGNKSDDYFLKTFKKSQGISAFHSFQLPEKRTLITGFNIAVARGKFARNTFNGEEGNQGPYRLNGENGELFIIIIAGTERVFVNGIEMQRGEQNQYTIDYNSGELVFTPNQLITSLDRIVVEFQFADNSFERSVTHALIEEKSSKQNWRINFYTEQDNRNKPFYTTFSAEDIIGLAQAGDNIDQTYKLSEDTSNITENTIRYAKIDSLVGAELFTDIYVQTNNKKNGIYKVTYSPVGQGNGDYIEESSLINGRVYKWVAPKNGQKMGSYAPIVKLIAPTKTRIITGQIDKSLSQKLKVRADLALSSHDKNTFSLLNAQDNNGLGARLILNFKDSIAHNKLALESEARAEYTSLNFRGIERFRSVEFSRTWNRQLSNQSGITANSMSAILVGGAGIGLAQKHFTINHNTNFISLEQQLQGNQQLTNAQLFFGKKTLSLGNDFTQTQTINDTLGGVLGVFSAQNARFSFPINSLTVEANFISENNQFKYSEIDSLFKQSFKYTQIGTEIRTSDTAAIRLKLGLNRRINEQVSNKLFEIESRSTDIFSKFGLGKGQNFRLDVNTTYRIFDHNNPLFDSLDENTLLNRFEYKLKLLKGAFQTNSYYQIGTGRERQFEILYLFVGRGLGEYVWADINGNGEQDLGEFRPQEYTGQGSYMRTIVNSNRYVNAISNEFYQSINIVPAVVWTNKPGLKGFISKISNQTNGSINRKSTDNNSLDQFNPFNLNIDSDYLISTNAQVRNSLYFNRMSSKFSTEYIYLQLSNKNLFVFGFESQTKEEHLFQLRWNTSSVFSIFPSATLGNLISRSEAFEQKNYTITYNDYHIKGQLQKDNSFRWAINAQQYRGYEPNTNMATVIRNLLGTEITYSKALKGVATLRFDYVLVAFTGEKNSPIGFALLNGLQPGTNFTWSIITNYQISKQAQLGVNYEGRYSETNKVIQTGSVNARWLF